MSGDAWFTVGAAAVAAGYLAVGLLHLRLQAPPPGLMKTNVNGVEVPAVLGGPLVLTALMVLGAVAIAGALGWVPGRPGVVMSSVAIVIAVMSVAGSWDDRRGDERARGFSGHLGALRARSLTGGLVKILAGVVAGAAAGSLLVLAPAAGNTPLLERELFVRAAEVLLLVALAANFVNLTDRAPGRAAKVTLLVCTPLIFLGDPSWAVASAPLLGALLGCLRADLRERAMLGDAGANPLGAVMGLGLYLALPQTGRWIAIVGLLALNLVSERWSYSKAIDATPLLRWLDGLGRSHQSRRK